MFTVRNCALMIGKQIIADFACLDRKLFSRGSKQKLEPKVGMQRDFNQLNLFRVYGLLYVRFNLKRASVVNFPNNLT